MATTLPNPQAEQSRTEESFEAMICSIVDSVEDKLDSLTPEERKRWLDDLSETAARSAARHEPAAR